MTEEPRDRARREDVSAHLEDERRTGRSRPRAVDLVDVERVDREDVVMVAVPLRRTWTTVGRHSKIGIAAGAGRLARFERRSARGNVAREPVPVARPRRRIGIEARDREALGAFGRTAPRELRRDVLAA